MRILKYGDKEFYISEHDYRILVDRLDTSKAKEDTTLDGFLEIDSPCLCIKYPHSCLASDGVECPFMTATNSTVGCLDWLQQYINTSSFTFGNDYLHFPKGMKRSVAKVHRMLLRLPKITRRKK